MSPPLSQDPPFADATLVVVSATLPRPEGDLLEHGALLLRCAGFGNAPVDGAGLGPLSFGACSSREIASGLSPRPTGRDGRLE